MLEEQAIVSVNGKRLPVQAGSVCVHGDNAEAVETARRLREGLEATGHTIVPLADGRG